MRSALLAALLLVSASASATDWVHSVASPPMHGDQPVRLASQPYDDYDDVYLDVNVASHHFCESSCPEVNNERNWGLGLTFQLSKHTEIKGGFYKNSYSHQSGYVLYNVYNQWTYSPDWYLRAGLAVGAVSGYYGTGGYQESVAFADRKLQLAALPTVVLGYKRVQFSVGVLVEAMTLQVQYRFAGF